MPSLQQALRTAQLVSSSAAETSENQKREDLASEEKQHALRAFVRGRHDEESSRRQERFLHDARREATQASSRVGTKPYFDRFKK